MYAEVMGLRGEDVPIRRLLRELGLRLAARGAIAQPEGHLLAKMFSPKKPQITLLKGKGTSAGQVTAPACVLRGLEDFGQMHPGDVLVVVATTPAWTSLFAMASAVVTDIGGPLSHSSIVAREYGIPAVMATGVATRRIHNGQTVTVDGTAGTVTLP